MRLVCPHSVQRFILHKQVNNVISFLSFSALKNLQKLNLNSTNVSALVFADLKVSV